MSIHIITDNSAHLLRAADRSAARKGIIEAMADDLVAGTTNMLDLTSESDVASYLYNEARYSPQALRLYTHAAMVLAQEIITTSGMGDTHD